MRASVLFPLFLTVAACGCGSSPGDTGGNPDGGGAGLPSPDAAATDPSLADQIEADVVGSYVARAHSAAMMDLPIVGPTENLTDTIGLATVRRVGDTFEIEESGCHVTSSAGDAVTTIIPDVVPRTTPATTSALAFTGTADNLAFTRGQTVTLVGVHLDDPADELPTDATDPRIFDQDSDGKPGVTVSLEGIASGDLYLVQRDTSDYSAGTVGAAGRLHATFTASSEQSVVDASNPLLRQPLARTPETDPAKNYVDLVRVDTAYDCDRAVAEADTLLP